MTGNVERSEGYLLLKAALLASMKEYELGTLCVRLGFEVHTAIHSSPNPDPDGRRYYDGCYVTTRNDKLSFTRHGEANDPDGHRQALAGCAAEVLLTSAGVWPA